MAKENKTKKEKRRLSAFEQLFIVVLIILAMGFASGALTLQNPDNPCIDMCNGFASAFSR